MRCLFIGGPADGKEETLDSSLASVFVFHDPDGKGGPGGRTEHLYSRWKLSPAWAGRGFDAVFVHADVLPERIDQHVKAALSAR